MACVVCARYLAPRFFSPRRIANLVGITVDTTACSATATKTKDVRRQAFWQ